MSSLEEDGIRPNGAGAVHLPRSIATLESIFLAFNSQQSEKCREDVDETDQLFAPSPHWNRAFPAEDQGHVHRLFIEYGSVPGETVEEPFSWSAVSTRSVSSGGTISSNRAASRPISRSIKAISAL